MASRVLRTLTRAPLRTGRPQDLSPTLVNPQAAAARLIKAGAAVRLARGYLVAVPDDAPPGWRPTIEAAGLGIAAAIHGAGNAILMGASAARIHHAIPRAINTVIVAIPAQHRRISLDIGGEVVFVKRDTGRLDARLTRLDTGQGLVTTPEQTLLDLAKRPNLGDLGPEVDAAIANLGQIVDPDQVRRLAAEQHAPAALAHVIAAEGIR